MYEAWTDASVREGHGYIAYILHKDGEELCKEYFKVNHKDSYVLEKVAIRALLEKVEQLNIPKDLIKIYTDHKGIVTKLKNRQSKVYKQFDNSVGRGVLKKYKKQIYWKSRNKNLAHDLTRMNGSMSYYNLNVVKDFI